MKYNKISTIILFTTVSSKNPDSIRIRSYDLLLSIRTLAHEITVYCCWIINSHYVNMTLRTQFAETERSLCNRGQAL
jgi:hypothetical protein